MTDRHQEIKSDSAPAWRAQPGRTAFVTGATGLLGNNLVRQLVELGVEVRALARSKEKAAKQFGSLAIEVVVGDINDPGTFLGRLAGSDIVFHTAAFFRDNYKGGDHWDQLYTTNVVGTAKLLETCYQAGVRRFVHTSSVATLRAEPGTVANETMLRREQDADNYYRSKILSDREVTKFLDTHPEFWATLVLPGWMHGPGDTGPTSAGQTVLDYLQRKLPGVPPGGFSVVDARDVAETMIRAAQHGQRGERYLAAGRSMTMEDLFQGLEKVSGIRAPRNKVPLPILYVMAAISELRTRVTRKPALISWAMVQLLVNERDRHHFDSSKSEKELGIRFRDVEQTLRDEVGWFQANGYV